MNLRSKVIVIVLCLLPLIPLWYFEYLPLQDYPNHLARLTILSHYEHSDFYRQNFTVKFLEGISPLPYLALDLFVTKVVPFLDTDKAMRLFISLYIILYMLGLSVLSRQLKLDFSLLALLNLPVMYSSFFHFGFLNFIFSIPLLLLTVWSLERYEAERNTANMILIGILSLLIYLSHIFTLFIFFIILLLYLFTRRLKVGEYFYLSIAISPSLFLSVNYLLMSTNNNPLSVVRYEILSTPFYYKIVLLTYPFSYLSLNLMVVYSLLYAFGIYVVVRNSLFINKRYLVLSLLLLFAYFLLPLKAVNGQYIDGYYMDVRVLLFSLTLFPLSLRVKDNRNIDLARMLLCVLFFISFSGLLYSFSDFNRNFSASCARVIKQETSVFPINVMGSKSAIRPYNSSWGYLSTRQEILTPFLFTGRHIPVAYKKRPPALSEFRFNQGDEAMDMAFLNKLRENYDYVLLLGTDPKAERLIDSIARERCRDKSVKVYEIFR